MKRNINFTSLLPILLMLAITIYFTVIILKFPLIGIEVREQNSQWIIETIDEESWASNQLINEGDILELINGDQPEHHSPLKWFNRVEMVESITISYENLETKKFSISYNSSDSQYATYFSFPFLFAILIIIFSVFLYWKKRQGKSVTVLLYFLLTIEAFYLSSFISTRGSMIGWGLNTITLSGSLILFMHFIKCYLERYNLTFINNKQLTVLYIFNFIALPIIVASLIFFKLNEYATKFELFILLLLTSYVFFYLIRFYVKHSHSKASGFLKIIWLTLFTAFGPAVFLYVIPTIFFKDVLISAEVALVFLMVIPAVFIYLQMTEKLFDIEFMLNRLRYYILLSFPISIIIVILLSFILNFNLLSDLSLITFGILFISITSSFYMKEYLDYKMKRHLFSPKYNFEASLYSFFQKTKHETQVNSLIKNLMNEIRAVLSIKKVLHIEVNTGNKVEDLVLKNGDQAPLFVANDLKNVAWEHHQIGSLIELRNGFVMIIGENSGNKNIIYSSTKGINKRLNTQEKIWLETLAYFSSILLENLIMIEELIQRIQEYTEREKTLNGNYPNWLLRLLFTLSEKERANLSIDLHDSVLQDQLQIVREIEHIHDKVTDKSIHHDLQDLQERMLDNIYMIRETCNELQPPFLRELGLIESIQQLIDQAKLRSDFVLKELLDESIENIEKGYALILYRVIQELLNNAMKHSEATEVELSLYENNEILYLSYSDNGKGMDMSKLADSFQTMGIFGIKERIHSIGGTINIDTAPGKGVQVFIEVGGNQSD